MGRPIRAAGILNIEIEGYKQKYGSSIIMKDKGKGPIIPLKKLVND